MIKVRKRDSIEKKRKEMVGTYIIHTFYMEQRGQVNAGLRMGSCFLGSSMDISHF